MPDRGSHMHWANRYLQRSPIYGTPVDILMPPRRLGTPTFEVIVPDGVIEPQAEWEQSPLPHEVKCFTDGSKTKEGSGAGFWFEGENTNLTESLSFCLEVSVFQMEMLAIGTAAETLSDMQAKAGIQGRDITIYSDSQSSLLSLKGSLIKTRSTLHARLALEALSSENSVKLQWIPAHRGIDGNEKADQLAKSGSNSLYIGPQPSYPIPYSRVKAEVNGEVRKESNSLWTNNGECRQTKMFIPDWRNRAMGENLMKLSKPELRDLVQVVTGHGNFSKHRHRCGKSVLPTCKYCGEGEETAEHHLAHCKGFSTQRHNAFGKTKVERGNFPRLPVKSIVLFNKGTKRLQAF